MKTIRFQTNLQHVRHTSSRFLPRTRFFLSSLLGVLIFLAISTCPQVSAQGPIHFPPPLNVDEFSETLPPLEAQDIDGTFPVDVGTTATDAMLGGERDVLLTLDGVEDPGDGASFEVSGGSAIYTQDDTSTGNVLLIYDGVDGDPVRTVASDGLGGVDLTDGGDLDGIEIEIARNDRPLKAAVVVFSSIDNASESVQDIPVTDEQISVRFPFSDFEISSGGGANLSQAKAVIVQIGALGSAVGPAHTEINGIAATSSQPTPSQPGVLHDQIDQLPSSAVWSVDFPGDNPFDAQAADDFTVPPGSSWTVRQVEWAAEWIPFPPSEPTANVTIYEDAGGVPSDPLFTETNLPIVPINDSDQSWRAPLPGGWPLGEGTYWCSVQANVPVGSEMLIKESRVARGAPSVWRNPGGGFDTHCSDWTPSIECVGQERSLAFRINGDAESVSELPDLIVTDVTHTPQFPRDGEPVTIEITVQNTSFEEQTNISVDWFPNRTTIPDPLQFGPIEQPIPELPPGGIYTVEESFTYNVPRCYTPLVRVTNFQEPGGVNRVHERGQICIAFKGPMAFWFNVLQINDRLIVTDEREVKIFDLDGEQIAVVSTTNQPAVRTAGDRIVVVDGNEVKLFDLDGNQVGSTVTASNTPKIQISGERIIVVDGNVVTVYDRDGNRMGSPISTTDVPTVKTTDNRIVIVDGREIKIFDKDGNQIGPPITTTSDAEVHTNGNRVVVVDGNEVKIYDRDGNQVGPPISTTNSPEIRAAENRIIVIDGNEIKFYDKDANQIGPSITTTNQPVIRTAGDRIIVVDGNEIKIYDQDGDQVDGPITTASPPRVTTAGDRIVVTEENQIRIFDKNGEPVGSPIITANEPIIRTTDDRILVIDGDEMSIYDATDGNRLGGPKMLNSRSSELMQSDILFQPGEIEKVVWVPLAGSASIVLESDKALSAEAYDQDRNLLDSTGLPQGGLMQLQADLPSEDYVVALSRPDVLSDTSQSVEVGIQFDDPRAAFMEETPYREVVIFSPLRTFPGGTDVFELPDGSPYSTFDQFVETEYAYSPEQGIAGLQWLVQEQLLHTFCPPAGHPGARPPTGSSHDDNFCGISAFIHSMQRSFPGALKADVAINSQSWDEVGDNLDHSCWFGVRGEKMVENVNSNYGGDNPDTQDGKSYCASRIRDTSPANLAAWAEDCDVKVLIYDIPNIFGHWADVLSVTPDPTDPSRGTLNLQDYEDNYDVSLSNSASGDQVDFSGAPLDNTMRGNFDQSDPVAGDATATVALNPRPMPGEEPKLTEISIEAVWFYVVCECDPDTGGMPTSTKSGKKLNR